MRRLAGPAQEFVVAPPEFSREVLISEKMNALQAVRDTRPSWRLAFGASPTATTRASLVEIVSGEGSTRQLFMQVINGAREEIATFDVPPYAVEVREATDLQSARTHAGLDSITASMGELRQLAQLLATGMTHVAIARHLAVSERTLRRRLKELMDEFRVDSRFLAGVAAAGVIGMATALAIGLGSVSVSDEALGHAQAACDLTIKAGGAHGSSLPSWTRWTTLSPSATRPWARELRRRLGGDGVSPAPLTATPGQ